MRLQAAAHRHPSREPARPPDPDLEKHPQSSPIATVVVIPLRKYVELQRAEEDSGGYEPSAERERRFSLQPESAPLSAALCTHALM